MKEHTFVICAYKESDFLEECILSLKAQEDTSNIVMVTSTDNGHIRGMAKKYDIPLFVNENKTGISGDWNFALSKGTTKYVTIAHQDDVYESNYAKQILKALNNSKHPLIAFSDYYEIRGDKKVANTNMLRIKRLLLLPLRAPKAEKSIFIRRRSLSFGDGVCCPSITYCTENIPTPLFHEYYRCCEDWEALEKLSKLKGEFVYVPKLLLGHRIHPDSETSKTLADGERIQENYEMFSKFWPAPVAKLLNHYYTKSEDYNKLDD